ncbi:MAG: glycosyltransferase family 9 protein [Pyrinomonadaceae bacterium]
MIGLVGEHPEFKNVLVIHFGQLGDVVLGLPALAAIRAHLSGSKITLLVGKATEEIVRLANAADEYISVDRVELRDGGKLGSVGKIFGLIKEVRRRRFDLVIDLHSLPETNLLGRLARIPNRLFANRESRSLDLLSNFRPPPIAEDKSKHLTERYFDVIRPLGISTPSANFELTPNKADVDWVGEKFAVLATAGGGPRVGLFPGAGNPSRCWPLSSFARLAQELIEAGANPIVFLGPEEKALRPKIESLLPTGITIIDELTIPQFIAAVHRLSVFVANDTGPIHLAAIAGVRIVLILDQRAPKTYLPNSKEMTIVGDKLIDEIDVSDVLVAVLERASKDV